MFGRLVRVLVCVMTAPEVPSPSRTIRRRSAMRSALALSREDAGDPAGLNGLIVDRACRLGIGPHALAGRDTCGVTAFTTDSVAPGVLLGKVPPPRGSNRRTRSERAACRKGPAARE